MPTAKLLDCRTLSVKGHKFVKGEVTPIPASLVPDIKINAHFELDVSDITPKEVQKAVAAETKTKKVDKPIDPDLVMLAIQKASEALDPDDEKNFLNDGRADARALSKLIGYTVTAAERDEALGWDDEDNMGEEELAVVVEEDTVAVTENPIELPTEAPDMGKAGDPVQTIAPEDTPKTPKPPASKTLKVKATGKKAAPKPSDKEVTL